MQIDNSALLEAIRATLPNGGDVSENAMTMNEIMAATGVSGDRARVMLRAYVLDGTVGTTKAWRKSVLGGYNTRVPAYYYKEKQDGEHLETSTSTCVSG